MPSYIPPSIDLQYESDFNVAQLSTRSHTESWYMLKFLCAMEGLVINPDRLESVRVAEDQIYYRGNDLCFENFILSDKNFFFIIISLIIIIPTKNT